MNQFMNYIYKKAYKDMKECSCSLIRKTEVKTVAERGTPSSAQNWALVQHSEMNCPRRHVLTKQEIFLRNGAGAESSRVREQENCCKC